MIGRFFDTKEGQVLIDGQELKHCNTHSIRDHLAIVSQDCDIFALSILENILYGRHIEELVGGFELVDEVLKCLREGKPLSPVRFSCRTHRLHLR
jgi:ABC-type multidrug transport system fused ATPase/permease subunit